MNRLSHLKKTLPANIRQNLHCGNVEIVVIDYNSSDNLYEWMFTEMRSYISQGILNYFITKDPQYFKMSHAKNLASKCAKGNVICNIDADNFLGENFAEFVNETFNKNKNVYLVSDKDVSTKDNFGRICVRKKDFLAINGYDEKMIGYGWEDIDLCQRLEDYGIKKKLIRNLEHLQVIHHTDEERFTNYRESNCIRDIFIHYVNPDESHIIFYLKIKYLRNGWRKKYNIPSVITVDDSDNKLLIDFNNPLCVQVFLNHIKNKHSIRITEFIQKCTNSIVKDSDGNSYSSQFVLSLKKEELNNSIVNSYELMSSSEPQPQRNYIPGSKWLYYKIFCGPGISDEILVKFIKPLINKLLLEKRIYKWFFIRYSDPSYHLRLRLKLTDTNQIQKTVEYFNILGNDFLRSGLIWNLSIDTYQREIERYKPVFIDPSETFFFIQSSMILSIIEQLSLIGDDKLRWVTAIISIDKLLDTFNFSLVEKKVLFEHLSEAFGAEFGKNKLLIKQLSTKFRTNKDLISMALNGDISHDNVLYELNEIIHAKAAESYIVGQKIMSKMSNKTELEKLMKDYIHMLMNRFFKSDQRMLEMVVYDFLYQFYKSTIAQQKNIQHENL